MGVGTEHRVWMDIRCRDHGIRESHVPQTMAIHKPSAVITTFGNYRTGGVNDDACVVVEAQPLKRPEALPAFTVEPEVEGRGGRWGFDHTKVRWECESVVPSFGFNPSVESVCPRAYGQQMLCT